MSLAIVLIVVVWAGVTAYAVLGGADFGGGVLHLLARRPDAERQRAAIAHAMGPVWEANHVWLIFALTALFSAFPTAFGDLGRALFVPVTVALVAIVVRGAAFAFATAAEGNRLAERRLRHVFALASAVAPFAFGTAAGGLAQGSLRWLGAFQLALGALAIALCSALAATFMVVEMARADERELANAFRSRALGATIAVAVLAPAALALAAAETPPLFDRLTGVARPVVVAGVAALLGAAVALWRRRDRLARAAVALAAVAIVWAWGIAQYPRLAGPGVTVAQAAASGPELSAVAVIIAAGFVVLAPALWLLYVAFRRQPVEVGP